MTDAARLCASVLMAYGFVFLLTFLWHLIATPPKLASEQTETIKQNRTEITGLNDKLKAFEPSLDRQRQTRITFAGLMEDGKNLETRLITAQSGAESSLLTQQLNDWIKRTECAFIESDLQTDASAFVHSGERPSPEQMKAIPPYLQTQGWKHYDVARIMIYLAKLQEIVERRGL